MIIDFEDKETQERIQSWIDEAKHANMLKEYVDDYFNLAIQESSPKDIYYQSDNITPYVNHNYRLFTDRDIQNMREYLKCLCVAASQKHTEWPTITIEALQNPDIAEAFANRKDQLRMTRKERDQALVERENWMNQFRGRWRDASKEFFGE